jgi:hypothetical protein
VKLEKKLAARLEERKAEVEKVIREGHGLISWGLCGPRRAV